MKDWKKNYTKEEVQEIEKLVEQSKLTPEEKKVWEKMEKQILKSFRSLKK